MAEEVKMEPVELTPVSAAEPPKVNPLSGATPTAAMKPGLKLPSKPGATVTLKPGLKLPPKPGATVAMKPGLKLPPKPGATVAMKPGLKLPPKPVIRKPGSTVMAKPLPKPVVADVSAVNPPPAASSSPTVNPPSVAKPSPAIDSAPVPEVKPVVKPVSVDAQGVGKLPTVEAKTIDRLAAQEPIPEPPKAMETLKSVTQKLKDITQEIPQQAILRKTGIIAEGAMSEAQKEAAKHKTARISLSDAMGVAPVKNENAPMKTIRIKRPIDIPGATKPLAPQSRPEGGQAEVKADSPLEAKPEASTSAATKPAAKEEPAATITQRKTLKISRPGVVRPGGKFGIKRPGSTVAANPAVAPHAATPEAEAPVGDIPEIADIPEMPNAAIPPPPPMPAATSDGPAWLWVLSSLVQAAACVALGALAWFLYQNTQIAYF